LDTHIWLWWINQDKQLTAKHQAIIAEAKNVFVSSISCWELVMLHQRQRIELIGKLDDWLHGVLAGANIVCLPMTESIAIQSARLDFHHRDPADRFIIATEVVTD
jgi:PIN domain nuclease of toxin-antitoxin system